MSRGDMRIENLAIQAYLFYLIVYKMLVGDAVCFPA